MSAKNENRPGYKKTKVGWIPEDWKDARLGEICSMKSGETITSKSIYEKAEYRCFGGNGLRGFTTTFTHDGEFVLIGRQGALCGNVHLVLGKFYASEHAIVTTVSKATNPLWLAESLRFKKLNRHTESSAQPGLSVSKVLRMRVPFPPLPEQKAIAEVLECWDRGIKNLELKIVIKRTIKKGLMQALLSGKIRLPGFGTTEYTEGHGKGRGGIPEGWKEVRLGSSGSFSKGKGIAKDDVAKTGSPCIRYGQIYTTDAHIATQLPSRISPELAQQSARIGYNDLLLAGSGETIDEIGKSLAYMGTEEAYAGGDIVIFSAQPDTVRADYLSYYLNTEGRRSVRRLGQGQSVVHVYARDLMNVVAVLPSMKEQHAIASLLSSADAEIDALERKLAVLNDQKRFLLNNLVTGSLRLPEFCNHGKHGMTQK